MTAHGRLLIRGFSSKASLMVEKNLTPFVPVMGTFGGHLRGGGTNDVSGGTQPPENGHLGGG